ncbi:hypothetical protein ABID56_002573 [Alkalibacillus flavidus]|uniref:Uncharacterized protein n=1 Tax=Alkalibacillus flavidus TaxID=546021 RepID=A0ABV2KXX9_9BACI
MFGVISSFMRVTTVIHYHKFGNMFCVVESDFLVLEPHDNKLDSSLGSLDSNS